MHPFRTFLFFTVIIVIAFLFKQRDVLFEAPSEFPPIVDSTAEIIDTVHEIDSIILPVSMVVDSSAKPLHSFFRQLNSSKDTLLRIIWMGDSQVEGDIMSFAFRKHFQHEFGGQGIGYMPAEMYFNTTEQVAIITNDFEEKVLHVGVLDSISDYGLYGKYFMPKKSSASIRIKNRSEKHQFQHLKIVYSGKTSIQLDSKIKPDTILFAESEGISICDYWFRNTPANLEIHFNKCNELKVYALLFDSANGVAVDHVAFRGRLNLMLNKYNGEQFLELGKQLNPSLIILQFGLNVIPDVRKSYSDYEIALERDIKLVKKYLPNVSVVVLGAPDMAHKVGSKLVSYKNIEAIIAAQKAAAENTRSYYWDMREAMGGKGVVVNWVGKGYVRTDYAHLTAEGASFVSEKLYKDLMAEYQKYLHYAN